MPCRSGCPSRVRAGCRRASGLRSSVSGVDQRRYDDEPRLERDDTAPHSNLLNLLEFSVVHVVRSARPFASSAHGTHGSRVHMKASDLPADRDRLELLACRRRAPAGRRETCSARTETRAGRHTPEERACLRASHGHGARHCPESSHAVRPFHFFWNGSPATAGASASPSRSSDSPGITGTAACPCPLSR